MATQEITSIIAYEHDKLYSCNEVCESCGANNEDVCCISYCKPIHFEELQEYCSSKNQDCGFDYNHKTKCIEFSKYAGIIQLQDGTYLEILPKITHNAPVEDSRKIFENLILASHNLTKEYKHNKITNTQIYKSNYILEIFISVFCNDLMDILKKGIKKSYIRKEENLNNYKGKLKFSEHIKRNIATKNKFFVEYREFSINIPENRILKSACLFLIKETTNEANKKILRRALVEFDDVSPCFNLEKDLQDKQINRLYAYYIRPLQYAEFFLRKQSLMPYKGRNAMPSLLFPLNEMFEDYIENILAEKNKDVYHSQFSKYNLISNGEKELFNTKMDFIVFKDNSAIILDAKWKVLNTSDEKLGVEQGDLYQLLNYSEIIKNKMSIENVSLALLYPKTDKFNEMRKWAYFNGTQISIVPIDVLNFDNNENLLAIL